MAITKSVPEVGVPKASVVLRYLCASSKCSFANIRNRFDIVDSQLLYAQIRSCARGRESLLIHLVERHNDSHRRMLNDSSFGSEAMLAWMDTLRDSDSIDVPPEDLKESSYSCMSEEEEEEGSTAAANGCIVETTVGGRIYPQDAVATLLKYACSLRSKGENWFDDSLFETSAAMAKTEHALLYTSTIRLLGSPIDGVAGSPEASKPLSRRSAAFAACKRLLKLGELDYRIVPLPPSDRPGPPSVGVKEDAGRVYRFRTPHFWSKMNAGPVSDLYTTVIRVTGIEGPYAPLLMFTRQPLTKLPPFDLFVARQRATVEMFPGGSFNVDGAQAEAIHGFTLRMMKVCLNKDVICPLQDMTYFLGAATKSWQARALGSPAVDSDVEVDWDLINLAAEKYAVPISNSAERPMDEDLEDAVIQDRWTEFTRRFFSIRVRHDMSPLSKPGESDVRM
jgi:endoribonuclease Dicer